MFNRLSGVAPKIVDLVGGAHEATVYEDYFFCTVQDQVIDLPASPTQAITFLVIDVAGVASAAHPITINGNGGKLIAGQNSFAITVPYGSVRLIFSLTSNAWTIANADNAPVAGTASVSYVTVAAYQVLAADSAIVVNHVGATTVTLEAAPADGRTVTVTDGGGNASTGNITINGNGKSIVGNATFAIALDHSAQTFVYSTGLGAWSKA